MSHGNEHEIALFLADLEYETRNDVALQEAELRRKRERQRIKNSQHWAIAATKYMTRFSDSGPPIIQAMPKWASAEAICQVYEIARELTAKTGVVHEVDHIVPLRSKLVSGLHVEFNLKPIPKTENNRKGNRYWPDMP